MKKLIFILITTFLCPLVSYSNPVLRSYKATYQVQAHGFNVGTITRELKFNPPYYELIIHSKSQVPLLALNGTESSRGLWKTTYPIPLSYHYEYDYQNKNKQKIITFNWEKSIAELSYHSKIAISPQTQDKVSYQLALSYDLQRPNSTLRYQLIDDKKIKVYQFVIRERKPLQTSLGKLDTILIERKSPARTTQLWLAPALNYVIVQAKHFNQGKLEASAEIDHIEWL